MTPSSTSTTTPRKAAIPAVGSDAPVRSRAPRQGRGGTRQRRELVDELLTTLKLFKQHVAAAIPEDIRDELAGITPHQLDALWQVVDRDGLAMHELARTQGVGVSSCTALIDRLLRQELVVRAGDPSDRRVVRVVPTERGRQVVARYRAARRQAGLSLLAHLDDEEAATFLRLMRTISGSGSAG